MTRGVAHGVRLLVFALVLCVAGRATAGERISVFMVVDGDRALAENLVEVTISRLSGAGDWELVGMRELESHWSGQEERLNDDFKGCLEAPECLAAVGARAGTPRAVIGRVLRSASSYDVELSLVQTATFAMERHVDRATARDVNELITLVQRGAATLFELDAPPPAVAAPVGPVAARSGTESTAAVAQTAALGSMHSATPAPLADAGAPEPVERSSLSTTIGFGAAGLAVVAFSAAVIAGSVAKAPPTGETRKERQEDLERRNDYAVAANIAFATGGVLSAVAVVAFVWE